MSNIPGSSSLSPQAIILAIMNHFNIKSIVNIDDIYEENIKIEDVLGLLTTLDQGTLQRALRSFPNSTIDSESPYEVWATELRDTWDTYDNNTRDKIAIELVKYIPVGENNSEKPQRISDNYVAQRLSDIFSFDQIGFYPCAPSEWQSLSEDILSRANDKSKVLCLFDQDLSGSPHYHSQSGQELLKNVVAKYGTEFVICGLLTHTIQELDNELEEWRRIAKELGLSLHNFLPLAKKRLEHEDEANLLFADAIKKTTLNMYCEKIKLQTTELIKKANESVIEQIMEIDVYDFDYMVMLSSYQDGVWEAETFIRLYQILQRDEVRSQLLEHGAGAEFNELVQTASPLSQLSIPYDLSPSVSELRRKELYESSRIICNSPLQAGDIFRYESVEADGAEKTISQDYILLAQPCDLTVRGDGNRYIEDLLVPLVPIEKLNTGKVTDHKEQLKKKGYAFWRTHNYMLYYHDDTNDIALIHFKKATMVDVRILELAVLNEKDYCQLDVSNEPKIPSQLPIGWQKYLLTVFQHFKSLGLELDEISQDLEGFPSASFRKQLWERIMPKFTLSNQYLSLPPIPYKEQSFDFNLKRIKRYREPGATYLLKSYTDFLSRTAEDHDFAYRR